MVVQLAIDSYVLVVLFVEILSVVVFEFLQLFVTVLLQVLVILLQLLRDLVQLLDVVLGCFHPIGHVAVVADLVNDVQQLGETVESHLLPLHFAISTIFAS